MTENLSFLKELSTKTNEFYGDYEKLMKNYHSQNIQNKIKQQKEEQLSQLNPSGGKPPTEEDLLKLLNKKNTNEIDPEGGKIIIPEPFCAVKLFDKKGGKVFFNITTHDDIQPPNEEHILEMNSELGIRIPLSLSERKEDFDVNRKACQVYDIILSSKIKSRIESELDFIVILICERIKQRFNQEIVGEKYSLLKNLKYKGGAVSSQRVKIKQSKIKEIIPENHRNLNSKMKSIAEREVDNINKPLLSPDWGMILIMRKFNTPKDFFSFLKVFLNYFKENNLRIRPSDYIEIFKRVEVKSLSLSNTNEDNNELCVFDYIMPYISSLNYSKQSAGFLYVAYLPLLSKSFAIKLKIQKGSINLLVPKMYSLDVLIPYHVKTNSIKSYFDITSRYLFIYFDNNDYISSQVKENATKNIDLSNTQHTEKEKNTRIENIDEEFAVNINDAYIYDVID